MTVRRRKGPSFLGAFSLLFVVFGSLSFVGYETAATKATVADLMAGPLEVGQGDCDWACFPCIVGHLAFPSAAGNAHADHEEECESATNCNGHECEKQSDASVNELWQDLLDAHQKGTRVRLDRYSNFAHYNAERRSVQIKCDMGYVIANVPIPESLVHVGE